MKKHIITTNSIMPPEPSGGGRGRKMRKKLSPEKKKAVTISTIVSIVLLLCLAAWGINAFLNTSIGIEPTGDPDLDSALDSRVTDKVTVLLLGIDAQGVNTDTIMLAMLDCKNKTMNIMSIPRDTRVANPWGGGGYAKINSVYIAKGMSGVIKQVGELTGLPINYYLMVNYEGFRKAVDVLGGVDFDVPMRLKYDDPAQNLHINLQAGMQHLNGDKAEQLVRSRNQYPEADLTRTQVQRDFLKAMIKQHAVASNIPKIDDLFKQLESYVTTNMKIGHLLKYAPVLAKIPDENIRLFMIPGHVNDYAAAGESWYLCDAAEMEKLAKDIFATDVKIAQTSKPIVGLSPPSPSKATSAPKNTPTIIDVPDDNEDPATPKPAAEQQPTPKPTLAPVRTHDPVPDTTSAPTRKPSPTHSPSGTAYPDGL